MVAFGFFFWMAGTVIFIIGIDGAIQGEFLNFLGTALWVSGTIFVVGAKIRDAIHELKDSPNQEKQPRKGGGHGSG